MARQLPRPQRRGHAHGDAGHRRAASRRRTWRRRSRGSTSLWRRGGAAPADGIAEALGAEAAAALDPFDRVQLAEVLRVCQASRSLSDAGRALFAASRARKSSVNDADRLRKYLARFGLSWKAIAGG